MNKRLSLALTSLFFTLTTLTASPPAPTQDGEVNQSVRERLVGAWRLAWLEEEGADGNVHRADCTGLLVYRCSSAARSSDAVPKSAPAQGLTAR
jgi:hypothetical protein